MEVRLATGSDHDHLAIAITALLALRFATASLTVSNCFVQLRSLQEYDSPWRYASALAHGSHPT
jgi:hypothetical protein